MRRQDWAFGIGVWGVWRAAVATLEGGYGPAFAWGCAAFGALALARYWSARHPAPMPHALRWTLFLSRPGHSTRRLARLLELEGRERVLEIGPGVGFNAIALALRLPQGAVDVVDVQPAMLESVMRRAAKKGVRNLTPTLCSGERLPFPDESFDAALLLGVLGELPEPQAALFELQRVLKPGGRLAVGEFLLDPDFVSLRRVKERAAQAGFRYESRVGVVAYIARFTRADSSGWTGSAAGRRGPRHRSGT